MKSICQEKRIFPAKDSPIRSSGDILIRDRSIALATGNLRISEVTILPMKSWEIRVNVQSLLVLLPLVGTVAISGRAQLEPGSIWSKALLPNASEVVCNPFEEEPVHLICIEIPTSYSSKEQMQTFEISSIQNSLVPVSIAEELQLTIGNIEGRVELVHRTNLPSVSIALTGAFEFENCLLEQGDCLWISAAGDLEMESLSREGLLLILEGDWECS
ncbi:hypothetical protein [Algoriphagus vanfongensis]|uniref:hypothetical protein n=1 Tax=Algoriphagus vanfongensis TaxID=426371 RepID=UPI000478A9E2|nr:hypothetical protein [Algoriphagus vanfongensis]